MASGPLRSLPSSSTSTPNQVATWKAQLESKAADAFGVGNAGAEQPAIDVKSLHAKIGELTLENIFRRSAQ